LRTSATPRCDAVWCVAWNARGWLGNVLPSTLCTPVVLILGLAAETPIGPIRPAMPHLCQVGIFFYPLVGFWWRKFFTAPARSAGASEPPCLMSNGVCDTSNEFAQILGTQHNSTWQVASTHLYQQSPDINSCCLETCVLQGRLCLSTLRHGW
jgi:hypothetical protein